MLFFLCSERPNIATIWNQTNYILVSYILMFRFHEHMHYILLNCKIQQQQRRRQLWRRRGRQQQQQCRQQHKMMMMMMMTMQKIVTHNSLSWYHFNGILNMKILLVQNLLVVFIRHVLVLKPFKQSAYSKCHLLRHSKPLYFAHTGHLRFGDCTIWGQVIFTVKYAHELELLAKEQTVLHW